MKTYLDCFPCFLSQALRAARIATADEKKIKRVLDAVGRMLEDIPLESTPPESGRLIYRKVSEITGVPDPYKKLKDESTERALALYPLLRRVVEDSEDRLMTAVRVAIAGNVIDFGANWDFDLEKEVAQTLENAFEMCDFPAFKKSVEAAEEVLYLGDNAGECVFDRILIEEIRKPVRYVVRGAPIINDATYDDAVASGIDQVATILSSGTDGPGTILHTCSREFMELYNSAQCIVSKGQGNYEALSREKRPLFFLLKTKCSVLADDMGVREGSTILKYGGKLE